MENSIFKSPIYRMIKIKRGQISTLRFFLCLRHNIKGIENNLAFVICQIENQKRILRDIFNIK